MTRVPPLRWHAHRQHRRRPDLYRLWRSDIRQPWLRAASGADRQGEKG